MPCGQYIRKPRKLTPDKQALLRQVYQGNIRQILHLFPGVSYGTIGIYVRHLGLRRPKPTTIMGRFMEYISMEPMSGCWLWTGSPSDRYGSFSPTKKTHDRAHRISWTLHFGNIPEGMCVLHKCDTPGCVNPQHLFLGSSADNVHDCVGKRRNRCPKGSRHIRAKLTEEDILKIRNDVRPYKLIAQEYGVAPNTISAIRTGTTWKNMS